MFNLKTIKGGKVVYIFDKSCADVAINLAPSVMAKVLGITSPEENTKKKSVDSLQDIRLRVESVTEPIKLTAPKLKQKPMSKQELADEICRIASRIETSFGVSRRSVWHIVYEKFMQKTGVDVKGVKKTAKYSRKKSASSYNTLVDEGYGYILVDILQKVYDNFSTKLV